MAFHAPQWTVRGLAACLQVVRAGVYIPCVAIPAVAFRDALRLRVEAFGSQREAARVLGVSEAVMSRWVRGMTYPLDLTQRAALRELDAELMARGAGVAE